MAGALGRGLLGALALCALACANYVTPLTEDDVEARLVQAAGPVEPHTRFIPITAETRLVAYALTTEARNDPASEPSRVLSRRLAIAARRGVRVVAGGPYPDLADHVLRNALALNREQGLRGLRLLLVSPAAPSSELSAAAREVHARLYYRPF